MNLHRSESATDSKVLATQVKATGQGESNASKDAKFKFSQAAVNAHHLTAAEILRDLSSLTEKNKQTPHSSAPLKLNKSIIDNITTPCRPGVTWPTFLERLAELRRVRPILAGKKYSDLIVSDAPIPDGTVGDEPIDEASSQVGTDLGTNSPPEFGKVDRAAQTTHEFVAASPVPGSVDRGSSPTASGLSLAQNALTAKSGRQQDDQHPISDNMPSPLSSDEPIGEQRNAVKSLGNLRKKSSARVLAKLGDFRVRIVAVCICLAAIPIIALNRNDPSHIEPTPFAKPSSDIVFRTRGVDSEIRDLAFLERSQGASPRLNSKEMDADLGLMQQDDKWKVTSLRQALIVSDGLFHRSLFVNDFLPKDETKWVFLTGDQPVRQILSLFAGKSISQTSLKSTFDLPRDWLLNHRNSLKFLKEAELSSPSKLARLIESELELLAIESGLLVEQEVEYRRDAAVDFAEWYLHPHPELSPAEYHPIAVALRLLNDDRATEFYLFHLNNDLQAGDLNLMLLELLQTLPTEGKWSSRKTELANQTLSKTITAIHTMQDKLPKLKLVDATIRLLLGGWKGETAPALDTAMDAKALELLTIGLDLIDRLGDSEASTDDVVLKFIFNATNAVAVAIGDGTITSVADGSALLQRAKSCVEHTKQNSELRAKALFSVAQLAQTLNDPDLDKFMKHALAEAESLSNKTHYFMHTLEYLMKKARSHYLKYKQSTVLSERQQANDEFEKVWLEYCSEYDKFEAYPCSPVERYTSLSNKGVLSYQGVFVGVVKVNEAWQLNRSIAVKMRMADRLAEFVTSVAISEQLAVEKLAAASLDDDDLTSLLDDATEAINHCITLQRPKSLNEMYAASRNLVLALDRNERLLELPFHSALLGYLNAVSNLCTQELWKVDARLPSVVTKLQDRVRKVSDTKNAR